MAVIKFVATMSGCALLGSLFAASVPTAMRMAEPQWWQTGNHSIAADDDYTFVEPPPEDLSPALNAPTWADDFVSSAKIVTAEPTNAPLTRVETVSAAALDVSVPDPSSVLPIPDATTSDTVDNGTRPAEAMPLGPPAVTMPIPLVDGIQAVSNRT
ncbi:MAG TPA: hypothetical protein VJM34_06895 [Novosphingobium sp.]|nr:hypothetical protein [Novosphingobium sp.]